MAACIVVADDLTGANATGVLLTKMQYRAATIMSLDNNDPEEMQECDCLLYPTDSRGVDAQTAYRRVFEASQALKNDNVLVYSKRIDSTLRGNLGSETDAMLDSLGEDYIAVAAPCFPSSGRIVIGNYMLVNGTMGEMMDGVHALAQKIRACHQAGSRILTFDCVSQEDLDLIADACIESGEKIIAVDPGAFTASLARKIIKPRMDRRQNHILVVVGSVNSSTTAQLEEFWLTQEANNVMVRTRELLEGEERREKEISRVVGQVLKEAEKYTTSSVVGDGIYLENRIDFRPYMERYNCSMEEVTDMINNSLAEITVRLLRQQPRFQGLYACGGDVTQALCGHFGAAGLDLKDEVLPLAAYGQFSGGEFDGLDFITKGGSQGDKTALNVCVNYLKEKLFI